MKFEQLVPSLFYADLKDSFPLLIDCLGFRITHEEFASEAPYYVIERDGLGMLVFQNEELAEKERPELRLVTHDIEAVYSKIAASHPQLLHPNLDTITLRPWGAKEFAILDGQVGFRIQQWPVADEA